MREGDHIFEFGPFRLDAARRELRRGLQVIKLFPKEFDTLLVLVERQGEVVEKDELLRRVWPDATVEEGNLTTHVSHLRKVLGGSTGSRDYIVTVPGRGYQFVAPLARQQTPPAGGTRRLPMIGIGIAVVTMAVGIGAALLFNRSPNIAPPAFHQLTFQRGTIWSARFAPDGQTIVYGAAWDGRPIRLFSTRPNGPESRALGLDADILSIAPSGEMAIATARQIARFWDRTGSLAQVSLAGGEPREILDDVKDADWSPDGRSLAVVRRVNGRDRLEFPIGTVLQDVQGFMMCPRVSRTGDAVAFLERRNGAESIELIAIGGAHTTVARFENVETGLAWSSSGNELLFTVVVGGATELRAVTRAGKQRLVTETAGEWLLFDVSRDGRILMGRNHTRGHISGVVQGETHERDLSWLDRSVAVALSANGRTLLLSEIGAAGGQNRAVYVRKTDGSPAVKLGDGGAMALSPDGKWVVANQGFAPERLVLLPTGPGQARPLNNGAITDYYSVRWLPDGRHIVFGAIEPGRQLRNYIQDTQGGDPRPASPTDPGPDAVFLPDGRSYVGRLDRRYFLFDSTSRGRRAIPSLTRDDYVVQASADGHSLFVAHGTATSAAVDEIDLRTGKRKLWKQIVVADPAGVMHPGPGAGSPPFLMTADGSAYAYNFLRVLSDLYLVDGLR
jgi:DNA-binding winged helix-turn-helix (wHTH) protein/Tol biopolymer transport system component